MLKKAVVFSVLIAGFPLCFAQSTSTWIPLGNRGGKPEGKLGASYISINLVAARVYQNSNWWTQLVERQRSALATVAISGSFSGGRSFSDKRISPPMALQKNDINADFGWAQSLLRDVPLNFVSMQIDVTVAKTAQDGVEQLINAANDLSKTVPALNASAATMGTITATKMLADFIFNRKLAEDKLHSTEPLTAPAGTTLSPGYYAVLAGTSISDYAAYLQPARAGQTSLDWDGARLTYNGAAIDKISYFVMEVAYKDYVFIPASLPAAALSSGKNWARLYQGAMSKINEISDLTNFNDKIKPITQIRSDAEQLLNEDADFVQSEKLLIQTKMQEQLRDIATQRKKILEDAEKFDGVPLRAKTERINLD